MSYSNYIQADVDASLCINDFKKPAQLNIECLISIYSGQNDLPALQKSSNGAITYVMCSLPLKFEKKDVYGKFITDKGINFPDINVTCILNNDDQQKISTTFAPSCALKEGSASECSINMKNTNGIGIIGKIIENHMNTDSSIREGLRKWLNN